MYASACPPQDVMLSRTLDELKAWLTGEFAKGPVEIAIVGDFKADDTIAAVAQTFERTAGSGQQTSL